MSTGPSAPPTRYVAPPVPSHDVVAAATGYRLGPVARENLRRIKFNIMDARVGEKLEPLGD